MVFPLTHPRHILPFRSRKAQHFMAVVFLLAYVLAGVAPLIHHHAFAIRLTPDPQVSTHTCGDFERHIPIDAIHGCFTCWLSSQRESTPAEGVSAGYARIVAEVVPEYRLRLPYSISWLLPDKRGPPVVA
jgi:hypothetical protein